MFKLAVTPTFTASVIVEIPSNKGQVEKRNFDAEFKRLSAKELAEYRVLLNSGELDDEGFVRIVLVGWDKVIDEHKAPVPFTEEVRDELLNIHPVTPAVIKAFFSTINGAALKN